MRGLAKRIPWGHLAIAAFATLAIRETLDLGFWRTGRTLNWDIEAYYHYLPATIIHGDPFDLTYVAAIDSVLHPSGDQSAFGVYTSPVTGRHYIKFTYGTVLFQLPMFLLAHAWAAPPWSEAEPNGYSAPYQLAVSLSTIMFVTLALLLLRRFLVRHCSERASAIAIITIATGTNLFFYSTHDAGMSHAYLFFLFALVLERTDRWHLSPSAMAAFAIGLAVGLTIVTRPVDGPILLVPLLWNAWPGPEARHKWALARRYRAHALIAAVGALLPIVPQLLYWKVATGSFLHYTYEGESFDFSSPRIMDGLFGYRKGWLIYSPLVALGFAGIASMVQHRPMRTLTLPLLVFFPVFIYVVFSWEQWWYGGGFGCRPLVSSLALLALPIAHLTGRVIAWGKAPFFALAVVILLGIRLNFFQQAQFRQTIIHWDSMTKERYWEVFGVDRWDDLPPFPS